MFRRGKKASAVEAKTAKGKERQPEAHRMQDVTGEKDDEKGKTRAVPSESGRDETQPGQQQSAKPHTPYRPHHPQYSRLDTIMSIPDTIEQEASARPQTVDDGQVKKTDFAIGGDDVPTSSGSTNEHPQDIAH